MKPADWIDTDDAEVLRLRDELALPWVQIATHFPGRTDGGCAARYRRLKGLRKEHPQLGNPRHDGAPGMERVDDRDHVARLCADGGFPVAEVITVRGKKVTIHVWPVRSKRAAA